MPAIAPAIIAGLGSLFQAGIGIKQLADARKLRNVQRPVMTTPQALTDLYRRRKFSASVYGMPGMGQIRAGMDRRTAGSLAAIKQSGQSAAEMMAGIAAVDQATKEQEQALGVQAAQYQAGQQQLLDQAQREMAAEERRQFAYNFAEPFDFKRQSRAALLQGGYQNLFDFAKNLSEVASKFGTSNDTDTDKGKVKVQ